MKSEPAVADTAGNILNEYYYTVTLILFITVPNV
jgi:hypothetical protein